MVYRMGLAAICAINPYAEYTPLILVAICLAFMLYFLINLPYKQTHQNYRSFLINVTILAMMVVANYYTTMKSNTPMAVKARIYTPVIILLVLIACCIGLSVIVAICDLFAMIAELCKSNKRGKSEIKAVNTTANIMQILPTLETINNNCDR